MGKFCVLFDMDGVLIDTESQYDEFWAEANQKFQIGIPDIAQKVKGFTLSSVISTYFSNRSNDVKQAVANQLIECERNMHFPDVNGASQFVQSLKDAGVKIALVTSSQNTKMEAVYRDKHFDTIFDAIVTADDITIGKPDPMCYLLAAKRLGYTPENCFVMEDALSGIAAGNAAGMKVIGLSTTNPTHVIEDKVQKVIPDFANFTLSDLNCIFKQNSQQ
ncbi:MAG: HAD family phosphatase [Dysgonamonadaceae bacterium]